MAGIKYLDNAVVAQQIANAPQYEKSALTALRVPRTDEIGQPLNTYVRSDTTSEGGLTNMRLEASNVVEADKIVARNPDSVGLLDGQQVYNEWLIDRKTAIKNYGQEVIDGLGQTFTTHKRAGTIQAVQITPETLRALGVEGDTLEIAVDWSPEPMQAKVGDWLTNGGYSVSASDFRKTYAPVRLEPTTVNVQEFEGTPGTAPEPSAARPVAP